MLVAILITEGKNRFQKACDLKGVISLQDSAWSHTANKTISYLQDLSWAAGPPSYSPEMAPKWFSSFWSIESMMDYKEISANS